MGSSSSTNSQEISQTSYPQWTQDAQQGTFQAGTGMLQNFLRNPQYSVAGFTTDAMKGMDLARTTARDIYTAPRITAPDAANFSPTMGQAAMMGTPQNMQAAQAGYTRGVTASQATPDAIAGAMSPYLSTVADATISQMGRERDRQAASIGARAAAAGSFGGSREAIQRGQLDRNFQEQVGQTVATLMAAGYDKATATALANAQMRQVADIGNADRSQQTTLANANFQQQANSTNYAGALQQLMQNAQFQQQMGLANMSAANQMQLAGADYGLKQAQVNDNLRTTQQAREMSALQQLMQQGVLQQGQAQRALDVPWTALERLMALTPKQMNSQTVSNKQSETESSNPAGAFGSIASGLGSLASIFSDRNAKTDIEKVGKDPETGDMLYAYRYKGDPKSYPKVVGPMAQDVEKRDPSAVQTVGGKKIITGR